MIPYGRQYVDEADAAALIDVLGSDWLTTGPAVDEFEREIASFCGAKHAVSVSSGTAALHAAIAALDLAPGDEVIVPAMTFAATANVVAFEGGRPVFADVDEGSLLLDPDAVTNLVGPRTKAIAAVDYAGQPCDYGALGTLAKRHGLVLIADASHSLGATLNGRRVGTLANITTLSFHPVKAITTAEGGMVLTDDAAVAGFVRRFRNHGITQDQRTRNELGSWKYGIDRLGLNYRLSDLHSALGSSQLRKLPGFLERRRKIASIFDSELSSSPDVVPLSTVPAAEHAYHLYVVKVPDRDRCFRELRERGIGVNVHYIPVHLFDFYRREFGTSDGDCPRAEAAYQHILSLPMHPSLDDGDVEKVVDAVKEVTSS